MLSLIRKNTNFFFILFFTVSIFTCNFCTSVNAQNNYHYQYEVVKMDSTFDKDADLTIETYMSYLKQDKDKVMDIPIGTSKEILKSFLPMSPLSNLLVDILFEWGNEYLSSQKMEKVDLALLNFGGIRAALPQGKITIGDVYQIIPFDNSVAFVFIKGSELKKMFDRFTEKKNAPLANVQTTYSANRLFSCTIGGTPLEPDKTYTLVTIDFLALGGDDFLKQLHFESTLYLNTLLRDVLLDAIKQKTVQGIEIEGVKDHRVIIKPTP